MGLLAWLRSVVDSRPSVIARELAALEARVFARPLEEVERDAREWIASGRDVSVLDDAPDPVALAALPPAARRLFEAFPCIEAGGAILGERRLAPADSPPDAIVLGEDIEHARILVGRAREAVWVVEATSPAEPEPPYLSPSIWHYLILIRETSAPEWWRARPPR